MRLDASQTRSVRLALLDIQEGASKWPLWTTLAWRDMLQRYRGSVLGPFWITLSMIIWVVAIGWMYSRLFSQELETYVPYLCSGTIVWRLFTDVVTDACSCFTNASSIIQTIRLPLTVHVFRVVCRAGLIFLHNLAAQIPVMLYFDVPITAGVFWFIPGFAIVAFCGAWVALLVGTLCARFHDVPPIISSLLMLVFFTTPILWVPEMAVGRRAELLLLNPIYHLLEALRAPMLGVTPQASWTILFGVSLVGAAVSFEVFRRFRSQIVHLVG